MCLPVNIWSSESSLLMTHQQYYTALMEEYVFGVADKYITTASTIEQTVIMNLLLYIDQPFRSKAGDSTTKEKPCE